MEIPPGDAGDGSLAKWRSQFSRAFQYYLDRSTPHALGRWLGTAGLVFLYSLRVYFLQGFYIVSYGLGIYLLNLLIGFLSPKVDPELETMDGPSLPTKGSDEFKPFIRRLPEFKFCVVGFGNMVKKATSILNCKNVPGPQLHLITIPLLEECHYTQFPFNSPSALYPGVLGKAFCIAFVMTFFSMFDVPVFWPILLCYWIVLFVLTMKRQILHMIKYKYVPFNIGKQKYSGKKPSASSSSSRD
ncbi:hypothetical protein ACLOJK_001805 [Asimina triloba]